jgi:hypothetical protein
VQWKVNLVLALVVLFRGGENLQCIGDATASTSGENSQRVMIGFRHR